MYHAKMSSGYVECLCCSEVIVADDDSEPSMCDDCKKADCSDAGDDCQIPQCFECEDGDGPRATLCTDGMWHSNCDAPCVNAGKSWPA